MIKHIALSALALIGVGLTALVFSLPVPSGSGEMTSPDQAVQSYITNVRLIENGALSKPQTIEIENGYIKAINPALEVSSDASIINGTGLTALPGLIDAHTHSYGSALTDALNFGVTANLDMFSDISALPDARSSRKSVSKTDKADLFSSGMMATAPGGHGTQYGVTISPITDAEMANDWVKKRKSEGSDYIKMIYMPGQDRIPSISRDIAKALITAAHEQGLLAVAHISTEQAALDLLEDGVDGFVHIFADKDASAEIIELARKNQIFIIPTLAVIASVDGQSADLMDRLNPDSKSRLSPMQKQTLSTNFPGNVHGFAYETALKNVKRFHDAGVKILAGSDAPNPGTAHGVSLHLEMQHLVKAGLTPAEALSAATEIPANLFDLDKRGSIEPDQRADIVLIKGNPLDDIANTLNISHIIKNGYVISSKAGPKKSSQKISSAQLSDFDNGLEVDSGLVWATTTDKMANGNSVASITVDNSMRLSVTGDVKAGFPYPWAGAMVTVEQGQSGLDISKYKKLEFRVKGTPGTYRLMAFNEDAAGIPPSQEFVITEDWQTVSLSLDKLAGFNGQAFTGFAFVSGPALGQFEFELDDVTLK